MKFLVNGTAAVHETADGLAATAYLRDGSESCQKEVVATITGSS